MTVPASFDSGWQQVGGPSGTSFNAASSLYLYDPASGAYAKVTTGTDSVTSQTPSCTGYWAYFTSPATVTVTVTSHSGDAVNCALAPGWNMIGNPFGSAASLPSGTVAYRWNGSAYEVANTIPVGAAVWIYNQGSTTTSISLTAQ